MYFADAQTTFYVVGTVCMIFMMAALSAIVIALIIVQSRLKAMKRNAQKRVDYLFSFARKGVGFMNGFRRGISQR